MNIYCTYFRLFALILISIFLSTDSISQKSDTGNDAGLFDDLNIENSNESSVLRPGEDGGKKLNNSIILKAYTSKPTCFVGGSFLISYRLFSSVLSRSEIVNQPLFSNLTVIPMNVNNNLTIDTNINGKKYNAFTIYQAQMIPSVTGDLQIPEMLVKSEAEFTIADNEAEAKKFYTTSNSIPISIKIKPLPESGKPKDFYGVVGNFEIRAIVSKAGSNDANDNILQLTITGSGNIKDIVLPAIHWPADIEVFDAKNTEHINTDIFPQNGIKTFNIPFVSHKVGELKLAPVQFSFFNDSLQQYETVQTDSIAIHISSNIIIDSPKGQSHSISKFFIFAPVITIVIIALLLVIKLKKKRFNKVISDDAPVQNSNKDGDHLIPEKKEALLLALSNLKNITNDKAFLNKSKELLSSFLQTKLNSHSISLNELMKAFNNQTENEQLKLTVYIASEVINKYLFSPAAISADERLLIIQKLSSAINSIDVT